MAGFPARAARPNEKFMERKLKDYAFIALKGMGMGAADVVPGVSGGTIAFIVGIYEELLDSIKGLNARSMKLFFTGHPAASWKMVNGNFLLALLAGIGISVFSLARAITWLLVHQPVLVWSFFFGLVLASAWFVSKDIRQWNAKTAASFLAGGIIAYYVTIATPAETPSHPVFIFLCGMIAICAMILPGISGSFILVLLGKYYYIMEAVKQLDILTLCVFGCGALVGITSFARVLSYALKHFRDVTIALLSGFMLGSLNKVWPWKEAVEGLASPDGGAAAQVGRNILPDTHVAEGILLMAAGFALVYFLERLSAKGHGKAAE